MSDLKEGRAPVWLTILASGVILTGIQPILPALPEMQKALGLSDSEIALVTSMYLLPSVFLAFPTGLMADRWGRRLVFVGSLGLFGFCGAGLLLTQVFGVMVLIRVFQGAAFAAVHPLSITMIGDARSAEEQVSAQGFRYTAVTICEGILPAIGGFLVVLSWSAPFALQLLALPVAIVGWFLVPGKTESEGFPPDYWRELFKVLQDRGALVIQLSGLLRFLFKFGFMTYVPILLTTGRGLSPWLVGVALGGTALTGGAAAALCGGLIRLAAPSRLVGISLILSAASFVVLAAQVPPWLAVAVCLVFGAADGAYGVLQNAMMVQVAPESMRAAFVSATGGVRNFGKFLAPSILGLAVLVMSLEMAFVLMGAVAAAALLTVPVLSRFDGSLRRGSRVLRSGEAAPDQAAR